MKNLLPLLLLFVACGKEPAPSPGPSQLFTNNFAFDSLEVDVRFDTNTVVSSAGLDVLEASGAVQSSLGSDLVWMINDSGNPADLFLVRMSSGKTVAALRLQGLTNVDWEDLAAFKTSTGTKELYIGDIGDNNAVRDSVHIYKMREPTWSELDTTIAVQSFLPSELKAITFAYENGPRDAEALLVHPESGALYVINKRTLSNGLYFVDEERKTATLRGEFSMYLCTGADAKVVDGDHLEVVVRNYTRMILWQGALGESMETMMSRTPKLIPNTYAQNQDESIWFTAQNGLGTCSEKKDGTPGRIAVYRKN